MDRSSDPGTIHVVAPEYDEPSGGMRRLYHYVDVLHDLGFSAVLVHGSSAFRCTWFENRTPIVAADDVRLRPGDLVVVPDAFAGSVSSISSTAATVLLNLALFLREPDVLRRSNVIGVVGVSEYSTTLVRRAFPSLPVHRITHGMYTDIFHPGPDAPRGTIGYMPRRAPKAPHVLAALHASGALDGWTVRSLDGLSELEVGNALRSTAIFLSFGECEGFPRPPLEAMASGCVVAGFTGHGGTEYFGDSYSYPVPEGDLLGMVDTTIDAIRLHDDDPAVFRSMGLEAAEFVSRTYSAANEREDLHRAFASLLESAASRPGPSEGDRLHFPTKLNASDLRKAAYFAKRSVRSVLRRG